MFLRYTVSARDCRPQMSVECTVMLFSVRGDFFRSGSL